MKRILVGMFLQTVCTVFCQAESNIRILLAGHTGYSGMDDVYQLWGWNILRYYYYLYRHLFVGYPWVVRVAYGVIVASCLGFVVIFCLMAVHVYRRRRNAKKMAWIKDRYFEKLKDIVDEVTENLSTEEIVRRMGYKPRKWKAWEMRLWSNVLVELTFYTNVQHPNLTNIQRVMRLIGFTDYVERQLVLGKRKDRVALMQVVRLTNMQLLDSIVTRFVNDTDLRLCKATRFYYMFTNKEEPYVFLDERSVQKGAYSTWDQMELHEVFRKIHDSGRGVPLFVPLLQKTEDIGKVVFFMHEIVYWGTDQDMRFLFSYFDSPNMLCRNAAFECMGIRRFNEAEDVMLSSFHKQSEVLRRSILNALLAIGSGACVRFFVDVYGKSSSNYTRRTALRCLWLYNDEGRNIFNLLKSEASSGDQILFEHVENPIINNEGL